MKSHPDILAPIKKGNQKSVSGLFGPLKKGEEIFRSGSDNMAKSKWFQVKDKLMLIEKWCRDGLDDGQIAHNLRISKSTLKTYKKTHPELLAAMKNGKEFFIAKVEAALAKRTMGFFYEETKTYIKYCEDNEVRYQEIKKKYLPPDVGACCIFLKNKDKDGNDGNGWADNPMKLKLDKEFLEFQKDIEEKKIF